LQKTDTHGDVSAEVMLGWMVQTKQDRSKWNRVSPDQTEKKEREHQVDKIKQKHTG
jgi:hypothetical protein